MSRSKTGQVLPPVRLVQTEPRTNGGHKLSGAWSRQEAEATVASYFQMLALELEGHKYNKTEYRRQLLDDLNARTAGAIERKHQNISAILIEAGKPFIDGYKPLSNYQELLQEVVLDYWKNSLMLHQLTEQIVVSNPIAPTVEDILAALESPPSPSRDAVGSRTSDQPRITKGIDYLQRDQQNSRLGKAGELFVLRYEQARLIHSGAENLADKIVHVSEEEGDGAGYDIRSYEVDGSDRLIEVKTTSFGKQTPFYLTRNELRVSTERSLVYHLYRVFKFKTSPRLFSLAGKLDECCTLSPVSYLASVR